MCSNRIIPMDTHIRKYLTNTIYIIMITSFDSFFFIFFSTIILSLAILVISLNNPIYSVLCLILVFINVLNILLLLKIEFFAILLILIYVGAISILFLFVVMMLDIKTDSTLITIDSNYIPISVFIIGILLIEVFLIFYHIFFYSSTHLFKNLHFLTKSYIFWIQLLDPIINIQTIGQVLYTNYFVIVLLAGVVLLIGLIGVVQLTLVKKKMKTQCIFQQISRNVENSYFLIKKK